MSRARLSRTRSQDPLKSGLSSADVRRMREKVLVHIDAICDAFNRSMANEGLDVLLDPADQKVRINLMSEDDLKRALADIERHGIHDEQMETAADAIANTVRDPGRSGVVLGALQSGKTGTAFSLLFSAPIHYLVSGQKYVPMFITTNQNSHLEQTRQSMNAFFRLYGELTIRRRGRFDADGQISLIEHYEESNNDFAIIDGAPSRSETSLQDFTCSALRDVYNRNDVGIDRIVTSMTYKRVRGKTLDNIKEYCKKAREAGYAVMTIVDEPQYGAADTVDRKDDLFKECLLSQIFQKIQGSFFDNRSPNILIGLSATPFDTHGMTNFFKVFQRLGKNYFGPNCFGGRMIDPEAGMNMIGLKSFSEIAREDERLRCFDDINYLLGNGKKSAFRDRKYETGPEGSERPMSRLERRKLGIDCLRSVLAQNVMTRAEARDPTQGPVGALLRLSGNSTSATEEILDDLEIEDDYNIIRFYTGGDDEDLDADDVQGRIEQATRDDPRPYLVVVVGKGRMGDQFPKSTEVSIDLTPKPSDMNALLQGNFGRMCGYDKPNALVIASDRSTHLIREYVRTLGNVSEIAQSRHTETHSSGGRRSRNENHLLLSASMLSQEPEGSPLHMLRDSVIEHLTALSSEITTSTTVLSMRRRKGGKGESRNLDLPRLMRDHGLAEYTAERVAALDPSWVGKPRILPLDGTIEYFPEGEEEPEDIGWLMDGPDRCEVLVRNRRSDENEDRNLGRSQVERRAPRGADFAHGVLPVIMVRKIGLDGKPLPSDRYKEPGRFVFDSISLQLAEPVERRWDVAMTNLPSATHAMAEGRGDDQKVFQLLAAIAKSVMPKKRRNAEEGAERRRFDDEKLEGALAANQIMRRLLEGLYAKETHEPLVSDGQIRIYDRATGQCDNPNGPAVIHVGDPRKPVYRYYHQGDEVADLAEHRAKRMAIGRDIEEAEVPAQALGMGR